MAAVLAVVLSGCAAGEGPPSPPETTAAASAAAPPEPVAALPAPDPLAGLEVAAAPAEGTTFGTLRVPRWGPEYAAPISEGITDPVLDNLGLGRFPEADMPGAAGNFALAGHRTLHSRPLYSIDTLEVGDDLIVTTDAGTYTYVVSEYEIVTPDQVRVVGDDPHNPGGPPVGGS